MEARDVAATKTGRIRNWLLGLSAFLIAGLAISPASAHTRSHGARHLASAHRHSLYASHATGRRYAEGSRRLRYAVGHIRFTAAQVRYAETHPRYAAAASYYHSGLQCVPYAREVSHIELSGDAFLWWAEAAGRYARGDTPVQGAVLNFRPIGRMPLGHVAVVTAVIDSRTILVTQANWIRGAITNDVTVQDVSPDNDWSQVQVELGDTDGHGAAYPVYGFIYNQPDDGSVIAGAGSAASTEVAEAPRAVPLQTDAPDRNLQ